MSTIPLADVRNARLQKAATLRELGINPYPSKCARTHAIRPLVEEFEQHEGAGVTVAGRLMSFRKQGALAFGHVQDEAGRVQLFFRRDTVEETSAERGTIGYAEIRLLDVGDIVEATGTLIRTERGEISVLVKSVRMLTKSLRPLPDKWAGLKDREAILRRRYLDTTLHPENRAAFVQVSLMVAAIRSFLNGRGFLEFQTPIIQPQYGGGTARPFVTHVNALASDMFLAISHELYLKRLIVAGFDRVYTIGRYFRNEGIDRTHQPEFSMLETMTAYENYEFNMELIEALFRHVAETVYGRSQFTIRGHEVDFARPWERVTMTEAVHRVTGRDFASCGSPAEANEWLAALGIREPQPTVGEALAKAFEDRVAPTLLAPTLVYGHPIEISPLAKPMDRDPRFVERFEIFVAGMECGDNWTEQNDPVHLLEVWRKARATGDAEAHPLDYDFIEALEYGMPPTTGVGPGIERMAMLFNQLENIDDVVFFPMMRPVVSPVNKVIYGIEEQAAPAHDAGDVVLTAAEFETLLTERILLPQSREVLVRPRLRVWSWPAPAQRWRGTGTIEVEGFLWNQRLRVVGYTAGAEAPADREAEIRRFAENAEATVAALLRRLHPELAVTVHGPLYDSEPLPQAPPGEPQE